MPAITSRRLLPESIQQLLFIRQPSQDITRLSQEVTHTSTVPSAAAEHRPVVVELNSAPQFDALPNQARRAAWAGTALISLAIPDANCPSVLQYELPCTNVYIASDLLLHDQKRKAKRSPPLQDSKQTTITALEQPFRVEAGGSYEVGLPTGLCQACVEATLLRSYGQTDMRLF